MAPPGAPTEPHDGTGRVQLSFTVTDGQDRQVRVPPGVTRLRLRVLERDRDRLHLRWPRHLPQVQGQARRADADLAARPAHVLREGPLERLAAGLPGHRDAGPRGRGAATDHPPQGGHRRGGAPGDPAARRAEALRRARRPVALRPAQRPGQADRGDRRPRADRRPARAAPAAEGAARGRLQGDGRGRRRGADRRRARRHQRAALRHRLRPRDHHRRGDPARPRRPGRRSRSPRG